MRGLGGKGGLADGFSAAEDIRSRGVERSMPPTESGNLASSSVPHGTVVVGINGPVGGAVAGSGASEAIASKDVLGTVKRNPEPVSVTSGGVNQVETTTAFVKGKKSEALSASVGSSSDGGSKWAPGASAPLHDAVQFRTQQQAPTNIASRAPVVGGSGGRGPLVSASQRPVQTKAAVVQAGEPIQGKQIRSATSLVGSKGIIEAVQSTAEQLRLASSVATTTQPKAASPPKPPLVATVPEKSVFPANVSVSPNKGVVVPVQKPAMPVAPAPPVQRQASPESRSRVTIQTKPPAPEAKVNVLTRTVKVEHPSSFRAAQLPRDETPSVRSHTESTAAAVVKPDSSERKVQTPREALNKAYSPYIQSTDSSLAAARARLQKAIAQTRQLRAAFTDRVYEKYRVVLRPVPEDAAQIVKKLQSEPRTSRANLEEEMSFIKREKDMEKRESQKAAGDKNPDDVAAAGGDQEGKDADTLEQLAFFGAGLSLVILPETEVDAGVDFFRKYKHRGPTDPETGQRVGGISSAAQAAAEVILDRVRKGAALRVERKRKIGELSDSGNPTTEPSSKVDQEVMSRLQSLPSSVGESTNDTQDPHSVPSTTLVPHKSTPEIGKGATPTLKGIGKESRPKLPPLALNLFSLSPSYDGTRLDGKMTAAALALQSCGVGGTVPGAKTAGKSSQASSQTLWKHPFPTSAAAQWLRTSAALKKSPNLIPPTALPSKGSPKTAEHLVVRPIEVRKRRKMKCLSVKRYDPSLFQGAERAVRCILESFSSDQSMDEEEDDEQRIDPNESGASAPLVSDVGSEMPESGTAEPSTVRHGLRRNVRKRKASEIGLFRNMQRESAEEKKSRFQGGSAPSHTVEPSVAFSVMCALGLIATKQEGDTEAESSGHSDEADRESVTSFCAEDTALDRLLRGKELRPLSECFMKGESPNFSSRQETRNNTRSQRMTVSATTGAIEHRQANYVASIRGGGESFLDHIDSTNPTGRGQFEGNSISTSDSFAAVHGASLRIQQSADGRVQPSVSIASNMLGSLSAQESDLLQAANGMSSQVRVTTGMNANVGEAGVVRASLPQAHPATLPFRDQSRPGSVDPSSLWLPDSSVRRELAQQHGNQYSAPFAPVGRGDSVFSAHRQRIEDGAEVVKYSTGSHTAAALQGGALQTHLGSTGSPLPDGFGGTCDHFGNAASAVSPPIVSLSPAHQAAAMTRSQMADGTDYFASGLQTQRRAPDTYGRGSTDWASLRASASAAGLLPASASLAATFGLSHQTIVNLQVRERAARAFLAREQQVAAEAAAQVQAQAASARNELANGARPGDPTLPQQPVSLLGASSGPGNQQFGTAHPTQPFPPISARSTGATVSLLSPTPPPDRALPQRNPKTGTVQPDVGTGVRPVDATAESAAPSPVTARREDSSASNFTGVMEAQAVDKPSQRSDGPSTGSFVAADTSGEGVAADARKEASFGESSISGKGVAMVALAATGSTPRPTAPDEIKAEVSGSEGARPLIPSEKRPANPQPSSDMKIASSPCAEKVGQQRKNGLNGGSKVTSADGKMLSATDPKLSEPSVKQNSRHDHQKAVDGSQREAHGEALATQFTLPKPPPQIDASWASLIASSRFHLVAEIIDGQEAASTNQIQIALLYLLAVGSAVPIQKPLIHEAFRGRLELSNSNGSSDSQEVLDASLWKLREIVAATILVWLWVHHEDDFRVPFEATGKSDVDWNCRFLIDAAVDASVEKLRSSEALRDQLRVYKDVSEKSSSSQPPRNGDSASAGNVKDEAWIGLNLRTASEVNQALVRGVDWSPQTDLVLGNVSEFLRALDDDRMLALRLKSQERILVATLLSRRVKISESFALAYTSALVRAGDALGYDDMCEIVQDRVTLGSSLLPFDIFISDTTGAWEDPCRPSCGFTRGLTGDELVRRAHARAAIHKALRKVQDRHGIRGGVRDSGPYADPPPINGADGSSPLQSHQPSFTTKVAAQSNRRESVLKRKASSLAETQPGFVVFGTPHTSATTALFDPGHSSTPFFWNSEDNSHMPYGRRGGTGARPKGPGSRSRSDSKGGRSDSSSRRGSEKATGDRTADVRTKDASAQKRTGPCSREIHWATVATMFQPVTFACPAPSPSPRRAAKPVASVSRGHSTDFSIVAPLCRTIDVSAFQGETSDDESHEEDISDETMLRKHQIVLDRMKQRHDKFMETRQHQTERTRRRTR